MFQKRTVIVCGAGTSMEVLLPSGKQLTKRIADLVNLKFEHGTQSNGDFLLWRACMTDAKQQELDPNDYLAAARRIHNAMPQAPSIDTFIDNHSGDRYIERCGKIAIVREILTAESNCHSLTIKHDRNFGMPDFTWLEDTWFSRFWALLTQGCQSIDYVFKRMQSITLIVFNYDRCIEQFLYYSVQNYYGIKAEEAARVLSALRIYHPYGKVGSLLWQNEEQKIDFGEEPNATQLLDLSKGIRTFTEETDPTSVEMTSIHDAILNAETLVFLGFAFHPDNMELITPTNQPEFSPRVIQYYATAHGMSKSNQQEIRRHLIKLRPAGARDNDYYIKNLKCAPFFDEFSKSFEFQ